MIKNLLRFLLLISIISVSKFTAAQGSDFQCTPTDLGLLPFATPCSSSAGFGLSSGTTQTGTTVGAVFDTLSGWVTSCHGGTPLHDVWYSFNASESHVVIDITGIGTTPLKDSYVAIYESVTGECVGLIPRGCDAATGTGLHTMEFGPLTLGVKYYLQIASTMPSGGDGAFNLLVKSKSICSDCSKNSVLNAYPLPVNAAYPPDTTVFFCYSVVGYNESFGNRLHGMAPLLGSGWDATTLAPVDAPDSVDFAGQWKWFTGFNVPGTGPVTGFFYDVGGDNNPANNLGDHGSFLSTWTFCFKVRTQTAANCAAGMKDLSIRFLNFADGESGSLVTSYDCSGDVDYVLDAHMECCPKPSGIIGQAAGCNNTPDGSIYVLAGFSAFGYEYFLYDETGTMVATHTAPAFSPYTFTGLYQGNYYLYFNENIGGSCMTGFNVYVPGPVEFDVVQTTFGCPSTTSCLNGAAVAVVSGSISSITWSNGETGYFADSLCTGWNYVTVVDTGSIACTIVDSVYITNQPFANPYFDYSQVSYCSGDSVIYVTDFPAAGGGSFSMGSLFYPVGFNPATDLNTTTGALDISGVTSGGYLIIQYTSAPPCSNSHIDTMYINPTKPMPSAAMFPDQVLCIGDTAVSYLNGLSSTHVHWFSDSALTSPLYDQFPGTYYNYFSGPFTAPGNYNFYLATIDGSGSCLSDPLVVSVDVDSLPAVDAGSTITVCPGFGVNLVGTGANTYSWSPAGSLDNPTLQSPLASPNSNTVYTVIGTNLSGCTASDSVLVIVDDNGGCDVQIYSGFTPNGDNHNDFWFIDGISVDPENQVYIFNRWGDKVWQCKGYNNKDVRWEGQTFRGGKIVPDGTYFYILKFKDKDYSGYIELTK